MKYPEEMYMGSKVSTDADFYMNANGWITPSEVEAETLDFEAENADDFEIVIIGKQETCRKICR